MKIRNRIKKFEEKNWIGFFSTRTKGMEFRRVRNILSLVHLQGIAQSIVNFRLYTLRSSSFFSWCNVKAILTSRKPFFSPFSPPSPVVVRSFYYLWQSVWNFILFLLSTPFLSLSLFILCESGIIIVQSYPSSLIRPPLLEKCSLHFPSRFYTPTDGCMNLTTVKLLLCLLAASTLWNVNLFSSYYILEVIKVSTLLFTCSFSPFLHRDRWTNNSKKATLWSSWSQLLYILSIIHLNAKEFWGKIGCTTNSIEYIQPLFRRPSLLAFLGQAQSNGFRNEAVDGPWLNLLNRRGSS